MVHKVYNPATDHAEVEYGPVFGCTEPCCAGATPGGNNTLIVGNEKGVQEWNNLNVIKRNTFSELGSDHDSFKQGIYTTNSRGDRD